MWDLGFGETMEHSMEENTVNEMESRFVQGIICHREN